MWRFKKLCAIDLPFAIWWEVFELHQWEYYQLHQPHRNCMVVVARHSLRTRLDCHVRSQSLVLGWRHRSRRYRDEGEWYDRWQWRKRTVEGRKKWCKLMLAINSSKCSKNSVDWMFVNRWLLVIGCRLFDDAWCSPAVSDFALRFLLIRLHHPHCQTQKSKHLQW